MELNLSPRSLNMRCKYESFGFYYESIHSSPPSGISAIRCEKIMCCEKVDFFLATCIASGFFFTSHVTPMSQLPFWSFFLTSSLYNVPCVSFTVLPSSDICSPSPSLSDRHPRFLLPPTPTHLFGRAVPGAMWQPRRLLRGPVPVRGGLDWRCVRPESVPRPL